MTDHSKQIRFRRLHNRPVRIVPAPVKRDWMEATPDRYAYRCLPLNIANAHGWQVLLSSGFRVRWTGGPELEALEFDYDDPRDPPAVSHFGSGLLTFHIGGILTTPKGVATYLTGPVNDPKPGITPLSGIVETDWLPFTATMNWKIDTPDRWIAFEKDDPYAMFFPVRLDEIEAYALKISDIEDDPAFSTAFQDFSASRNAFLQDLAAGKDAATARGWQKDYFHGEGARDAGTRHRTTLRLKKPRQTD